MLNKNRKYRCKKSINNFLIGNYYNINDIYPYMVEMFNIVNNQLNYYCFSLEYDDHSLPIFNTYFYTEQEERKLKIERLNHA